MDLIILITSLLKKKLTTPITLLWTKVYYLSNYIKYWRVLTHYRLTWPLELRSFISLMYGFLTFDSDKTMSRPVLSSHVLDVSTGKPAAGVFVELYKKKDNDWTLWHNTVTSIDGRIQFPFSKDSMAAGTYKLKFNVEDHYSRSNIETLYPYVEVSFRINTKSLST